MKLYSYFRSSAAYRVRIALNLKQIDYDIVPVNLIKGEQRGESYAEVNPLGLVPSLEMDDGSIIHQSLAICEWLEAKYPGQALIPDDAYEAAQVRACVLSIACDIHPINNLRILGYLENELNVDEKQKNDWYQHWVEEGFHAIEKTVTGTPFCFGTEPTLADVFLIPQVFNALRFKVDMQPFPRIKAVYDSCNKIQAFTDAHPDNQPDNPDLSTSSSS